MVIANNVWKGFTLAMPTHAFKYLSKTVKFLVIETGVRSAWKDIISMIVCALIPKDYVFNFLKIYVCNVSSTSIRKMVSALLLHAQEDT